ncbi:hypothetical protein ABIB48_000417 [Arthrobacter sp. UYCu511]
MATLRLTHKAIVLEVRRAPYEVELDGDAAGAVAMNESIEIPIAAGDHTVRIHSGRDSSRTVAFAAVAGDTVAYRCTGKRFLPLFLASFSDPALALVLVPEHEYEGHEE